MQEGKLSRLTFGIKDMTIVMLIHGFEGSNRYRIIFMTESSLVYILSVRHGSKSSLDFNPLALE